MAENLINFWYGTATQYNAITTKNNNTLYFITDTGKIYKGGTLLAHKYTLPTASSSTLGGVKIGNNITISNGIISVASGSTSTAGIVQLTNSTSSTSTTTAATPNSVKSAYDLANTKLSLSGGTMTGEIVIGQGDGKGIQLGTNGRINATGKDDGNSDYTVLGMQEIVNSNDQNYLFGSTHFNLVARGKQSCPTYNGYNMVLAGTPVSGEIQVNGGDAAGGSKIVLVTGEGQITNSGTGTLFGYTASDAIAVGHGTASLNLRGKGARPSYNSTTSLALLSDIPTKVSELTNDSGFKTTDKYHTTGSWGGLTYTATANGGAEALTFTLPTGTSATTVAVGNHTHSAYVNQNAFSNVKVGSTTVAADTTTDTLELVAGTNITLTPDATNDKITITATDTNTHYTTGITVGATGTTSNSAATNPFIKIKDDSTHRGQVQLKGSGATTVSSDANGVITISSTNTTYTFNGAVSTIKDSNLTASRALISNSSGKVAVSDVTSTELGYLDGVTSNIQTQLNAVPKSGDWWNNGICRVGTDGVTKVGKYIDFHNTDASTNAYDLRLYTDGANKNTILLPNHSGRIPALKTDAVLGSTTRPVYVSASGEIIACTGLQEVLGASATALTLTANQFGTALPAAGTVGRLFFKKA